MSAGSIRQIGRPQEIYDHPNELFVADFVGKTNRIDATLEADGKTVRLGDGSALAVSARPGIQPGPVIVALRPEAIRLERGVAPAGSLGGIVTHRIFLGSTAEYSIEVAGLGDLLVTADRKSMTESDLVEPGEKVALVFDPAAAHVFRRSV
jgi:spermidine/putrescine transport system ATP-binding protein